MGIFKAIGNFFAGAVLFGLAIVTYNTFRDQGVVKEISNVRLIFGEDGKQVSPGETEGMKEQIIVQVQDEIDQEMKFIEGKGYEASNNVYKVIVRTLGRVGFDLEASSFKAEELKKVLSDMPADELDSLKREARAVKAYVSGVLERLKPRKGVAAEGNLAKKLAGIPDKNTNKILDDRHKALGIYEKQVKEAIVRLTHIIEHN